MALMALVPASDFIGFPVLEKRSSSCSSYSFSVLHALVSLAAARPPYFPGWAGQHGKQSIRVDIAASGSLSSEFSRQLLPLQ
eukprot:5202975-Pleurochrysis_carterae.AAC.1